jgi:iron complex outermembrane recepter protein
MKHKLFLLFVTMLQCGLAVGQNSLQGRITDAGTGSGLPGATVYLPELKRGASTDSSGKYSMGSIPGGKFLVQITAMGYTSVIKSIEVSGAMQLDLQLDDAHTELDEVLVTGLSAATEKHLSPVPVTTIDELQLKQEASTNIIDAIARTPGISQISTGSAISKPVIRGLGYNRVIVLHDNIRQEGQQWGDEHGIEIDEYSIGKVEILKGPASLMFGSDGMAGAINFISAGPVAEGKIGGTWLSTFQTNNGLAGNSGIFSGHLKDWSWQARASHKMAGNYSNRYDGKVYNSGFRELNFSGNLGRHGRWGYSTLYFSSFGQEVGMIEGERDSSGRFIKSFIVNDTLVGERPVTSDELNSYNIDLPKQRIAHRKIGSGSMFFFSRSKLSVDLAWQQNDRRELEDLYAPGTPVLHFLLNTFNYDVKYHFPEKNGLLLITGINGMQQSSVNKGEEYLVPAYNVLDGGLFVFARKNLKKLNISAGVRFDNRMISGEELYLDSLERVVESGSAGAEQKFTRFDNSYSNITGSAGFTWKPTDPWLIRFNVARGFRTPNIAELGSNGVHEGTFRYEIGSPDLRSETSLQFDAGIEYGTDHVNITAAFFGNLIDNYIYLQKLESWLGEDSIIDPGDPAAAYAFVQGDAMLTGGEIAMDIHPHPFDWLHFENSFAIVYGVNRDKPAAYNHLPLMPAPRYQGEIRGDFRKIGKHLGRSYVKVEVDHFFKQDRFYSENNTETVTPGYTLLSAGVGTDLQRNGKPLISLYFSAANLLDSGYQNHLSRLKYAPYNVATGRQGVFGMGRNFMVKLVIPFSIR